MEADIRATSNFLMNQSCDVVKETNKEYSKIDDEHAEENNLDSRDYIKEQNKNNESNSWEIEKIWK